MRILLVGSEAKNLVERLKNYFPEDEIVEIYSEGRFYEVVDGDYDIVITDYEIPWGNGIKILIEVKKRKEFVPVIMVVSSIFEEVVIEAMKHGLDDYVIKETIGKLPFAIKLALERSKRIKRDIEYNKVILELFKTSFPNLDFAIRKINEVVSKTIGVERVSLWFYDENKKELVCQDLYISSKNTHEKGIVLNTENYPRYFEAFEKSVFIDASDAINDPRTSEYVRYLKEYGIVSMMDVSLRKNGKLIGVLCNEHNSFREWSIEERNFVISIAEIIVNLIESFKRKELEALYTAISEKSSSGIFILQDNKIKFANQAFINSLGYSLDELNKAGYISVLYGEDRKKIEEAIEKIIEGKTASMPEFRYRRKDGTVRWAVGVMTPIEFEGKKALIGVTTDITDIKKAEERYKQLFERVKDAVFVSTVEGKFVDANDAALKLLGYENKEELLKIDIAKDFYYNPNDRKKILNEVAKKGYIKDYEVEIKRKDGKKLVVLETSHEVRDEKGNLIGYEGFIRDITEKKEMEEKIREKEERFSYFFNNVEIGVWCFMLEKPLDISLPEEKIIDEAFKARCVECNDAYARMLGAKKEEIIGAKVSDFMPDSEENREYLRQAIRNGFKIYRGISHEINKRGEEKYFSNSLVGIIKENKIHGAWGFQIDITEEMKARIALEESEKKFRNVVESANDGIYIITPSGFEYVNPAFEKITGYSKEELLSKDFSFWSLVYEEDKKLIKEREKARIKGKKTPAKYEFRIVRKDKKVRVVEVTTVGMGKGEKIKVMGILRDITEKKEAEEEIKRLCDLHYSIGKCVNESDRIEELCKNFLETLRKIIEIDYGNIFIYEEEKNSLIPVAYIGYPEEFVKRNIVKYSLDDKKSEAVKAFIERKNSYIKNLQNYKLLSYNRDLYKKYKMKELLTIPLISGDKIHGVLQVVGSEEHPIGGNKMKLLEAISKELAAGIVKIKAIERVKEALERELDFKNRTAHYFFNPIIIAKGYLELAREEDGKDKIEKAIKAIDRIEKVVKNITERGEVNE